MARSSLTPLILCGGAGTRLWPVSRQDLPKQFVSLFGDRSSFQETVLRVRDPDVFRRPVVVTNERYAGLVTTQLEEIGAKATVLIEPLRRDSGPAIAASAAMLAAQGSNTSLMVLPSDHVITDTAAFATAVRQATLAAQQGFIVVFGIRPDHPATGYGYIQPEGGEISPGLRKVGTFIEKPDASTAEHFIADGYLWNAGMFVFQTDVLIGEYDASDPTTMAAARAAVTDAKATPHGLMLDSGAFGRCTAKSIDYAVIERSRRVAVIPVSMGWSDIGSWHAVWELSPKDDADNVAQGRAVFIDAKGNFVRSDHQLVCVVGLEGVAVVATPDAVLVSDRWQDASIKTLVSRLQAAGDPTVIRYREKRTTNEGGG